MDSVADRQRTEFIDPGRQQAHLARQMSDQGPHECRLGFQRLPEQISGHAGDDRGLTSLHGGGANLFIDRCKLSKYVSNLYFTKRNNLSCVGIDADTGLPFREEEDLPGVI